MKAASSYLKSQRFPSTFDSEALADGGNETLCELNAEYLIVQKNAIALIGTQSSRTTTGVSLKVSNRYKRPLMSFSASSVTLSDKTLHPYFLRTMPPDSKQADAITDLIYMYALGDFITINSIEAYGTNGVAQVVLKSADKGLTIVQQLTFNIENTVEMQACITSIKNSGVKIINAWITTNDLIPLLQEALNQGLLTSDYVWIFSETLGDIISVDADGIASISSPTIQPYIQGFIYTGFADAFWDRSQYLWSVFQANTTSGFVSIGSKFTYDAFLAYSFAIQSLVSRGANVTDGDLLVAELKETSFLGSSGSVAFDSLGDRIGATYQMINIIDWKLSSLIHWNDIDGVKVINRTLEKRDGSVAVTILQNSLSNQKQWKSVPSTANPPSQRYGSVFVNIGDYFYLFGGKNSTQVYNDLFQFDVKANTWKSIKYLSSTVPPPRYLHSMWASQDSLFLYGGTNDKVFFDDMYEFNLKTLTWTKMSLRITPGERYDTSVVSMDASTSFLFGGQSSGMKNDLWLFDGVWSLINTTNIISPRVGMCSVFMDNQLLIVGGFDGENYRDDVSSFDMVTKTWTVLKNTGDTHPGGRIGSQCYVIASSLYLINGNANSTSYDDIWMATRNSTHISWKQVVSTGLRQKKSSYSAFLAFEQNAISFGGIDQDAIACNDLWRFNTRTSSIEVIHGAMDIPPHLSGLVSSLIGNIFFIHGGRRENGDLSNELWAIDLDVQLWNHILPSTSIPTGREFHSMISTIDTLYMFGGVDKRTYMNDFYKYSYFLNEWFQIVTPDPIPGPRAGHCSVLSQNETTIWIYGGKNSFEYLHELWEFDIVFSRWTLHILTGAKPANLNRIQCLLISNQIIVYGGENTVGDPMTSFWSIDLDTNAVMSKPTSLSLAQVCMVSISDDKRAILYGGSRNDQVYGNLYHLDFSNLGSIQVTDITPISTPLGRRGHICAFYSDSFLVFGGQGAIPGKSAYLETLKFNEFLKYKIGDVCLNSNSTGCRKCSPGTYNYKGQCLACPPGTYSPEFGSFVPTPCPAGYIGSVAGASSKGLCTPCPFGTYNPTAGTSVCFPCRENMTCPIGTFSPSDTSSNRFFDSFATKQPIPINPGDSIESGIITATYISMFASFFVIFIVGMICWRPLSTWYEAIDYLFQRSHFPPSHSKEKLLIMRQTPFGGIFTAILIVSAICMAIAIILPVVITNNREIRTMIPNAVIDRTINFGSQMNASVRLVDYPSACATNSTCSSSLSVDYNGLKVEIGATTRVSCLREFVANSSTCLMNFICTNCTLTSGSANIRFLFSDIGALASGIQYSISMTAAYPDQSGRDQQTSEVSSTMMSDPQRFLRGITTLSTANILLIQTSYLIESDVEYSYGYMLNYLSQSLGDQVDSKNFSQFTGVGLDFQFSTSESSIEVTRVKKKSEVSLIAELLGSMSGLIGIMVLLIGKTEQMWNKIVLYVGNFRNKIMKYETEITDYDVKNPATRSNCINVADEVEIIKNGLLMPSPPSIIQVVPILEAPPLALRVQVLEAKSVPQMDANGYADPYIVLKIGEVTKKTKVVKKSLNPHWNQTIEFDMSTFYHEKLVMSRLHVTLFDYDFGQKDDFIGTISLDLISLSVEEPTNNWYRIPCFDDSTQTIHFVPVHLILSFLY